MIVMYAGTATSNGALTDEFSENHQLESIKTIKINDQLSLFFN